MNRLTRLFYSIGFAVLLTDFLVLTHIFLTAYSRENKRAIVNIDSLGEANLELFLITVTFPIVLVVVYKAIVAIKEKDEG